MRVAGWIGLNGKFYPCEYFGHLEVIKSTPALKSLVPGINDQLAEANDEHPCWHCPQLASRDILCDAVTALINTGCLRVANWDRELHFEGRPTATTLQAAKDLAEAHNMAPVFERV